MTRILCIISALTAGGAETFLMKVSRALEPEQYQLDFIVSEAGGCYTQEVLARGGRIYQIPLRTRDLKGAFLGIRRIVRENHYDVVLKLGETSVAAVDLIAARLGGARVTAMRSCNAQAETSDAGHRVHLLLRPVLNAVANVKLAPSILAAEYTFGKRSARRDVQLLHNGVDLGIYRYDTRGRERIRAEFGLKEQMVVGHVGRFHRQKNHDFLLEVFAALRQRRSDAVLLLVGTGALEASIREKAEAMGIADGVIFAGQRFDIPQLLSAMDVFVFPSFYEGMPNTVIEAQATGLPCVIADTITPEADLTGLVRYLPLTDTAEQWAEAALTAGTGERRDTGAALTEKGYDIRSVAGQFVRLLCPNG